MNAIVGIQNMGVNPVTCREIDWKHLWDRAGVHVQTWSSGRSEVYLRDVLHGKPKDALSKQTNLSKKRIRKRAEDEDIKSSNNITAPLLCGSRSGSYTSCISY